jgi:hypothetical protein
MGELQYDPGSRPTKQAMVIANTDPRYSNIALRTDKLVS